MVGARVTATVRDEHAREQVGALGVQALPPEGFAPAGPFDVLLELVGAPNLAEDLEALADRGRICVIGLGAGARTEIDLRMLLSKRATLRGSQLRNRSLEDKAAAARLVEKVVLPGFASGDLSVPVAATYPLEDAAAAYERFKAGRKLGKIVLVTSPSD
jgi:NADPH:quinone reductase-like Zn-dependent oxidoreductase